MIDIVYLHIAIFLLLLVGILCYLYRAGYNRLVAENEKLSADLRNTDWNLEVCKKELDIKEVLGRDYTTHIEKLNSELRQVCKDRDEVSKELNVLSKGNVSVKNIINRTKLNGKI